mmetsp:Transcript_6407/g.19385  ORF Transcript_6407/g.19385 Transcript_6407/m.19385 type:complete len:200 (-) Transcript_6407:561-1160(-)
MSITLPRPAELGLLRKWFLVSGTACICSIVSIPSSQGAIGLKIPLRRSITGVFSTVLVWRSFTAGSGARLAPVPNEKEAARLLAYKPRSSALSVAISEVRESTTPFNLLFSFSVLVSDSSSSDVYARRRIREIYAVSLFFCSRLWYLRWLTFSWGSLGFTFSLLADFSSSLDPLRFSPMDSIACVWAFLRAISTAERPT